MKKKFNYTTCLLCYISRVLQAEKRNFERGQKRSKMTFQRLTKFNFQAYSTLNIMYQ